MGYLADIYVIQKSRSKSKVIEFLDRFLPRRSLSSQDFYLPQDKLDPDLNSQNETSLLEFMEKNPLKSCSLYWANGDKSNPNRHGMVFYTTDACTIFGISRNASTNADDTINEDECLSEMLSFFETTLGYIAYESPPVNSYNEFTKIVKKIIQS